MFQGGVGFFVVFVLVVLVGGLCGFWVWFWCVVVVGFFPPNRLAEIFLVISQIQVLVK